MTARDYYPKVFNFEGKDFKMWRLKMEYLRKVMKILQVLLTNSPEPYGDVPASTYENEKWKSDDFDCKNEALNHLDTSLYGIFSNFKIAKELWDALIKEYATEDAGTKKYVIEQFLDFQMEEGKSIITQVRDFQKIIHEVQNEGMELLEQFVIGSSIHNSHHRGRTLGSH